jgi:hypothetical protein
VSEGAPALLRMSPTSHEELTPSPSRSKRQDVFTSSIQLDSSKPPQATKRASPDTLDARGSSGSNKSTCSPCSRHSGLMPGLVCNWAPVGEAVKVSEASFKRPAGAATTGVPAWLEALQPLKIGDWIALRIRQADQAEPCPDANDFIRPLGFRGTVRPRAIQCFALHTPFLVGDVLVEWARTPSS